MSKGKEHPIIVVRRIHKGHGHHGGAWKVAYADFVTAMMAFFLVMWLSAQDSIVKDAIAGYFKQPGLLPNERSNALIASGKGGIDDKGSPILNRKPNDMLEAEQKALVNAAEHIKEHFSDTVGFEALRDQVEFKVTAEGLRIELIDKTGSSFFASGSAALRGESVAILTVIADEIGRLDNDVVIEGHTDSQRYSSDKYGNWELSSERANAARRVMSSSGLRPGQLKTVRGFADTDLRIPDDPLDARNRRVSIVVRSSAAVQMEANVRAGGAAPSTTGDEDSTGDGDSARDETRASSASGSGDHAETTTAPSGHAAGAR